MAVLFTSTSGFLISHEKYIKDVYQIVENDHGNYNSYCYNSKLFRITKPFRGKYKNDSTSRLPSDINIIATTFELAMKSFSMNSKQFKDHNNAEARVMADEFLNSFCNNLKPRFSGGNNGEEAIVTEIDGVRYLIPKRCEFFCLDVTEMSKVITKLFDFILLDPPWWNKSIRKKRKWNERSGYGMIYNSDLSNLPIGSLLEDDGLVGVWCTNAPSHLQAIQEDIFPKWNVKYIGQWYWVKITLSGELVCDFSCPPRKQPFERLVFGARKRVLSTPEDQRVVISTPSAVHSHKPPLSELLAQYLPPGPKCLEVFARYLLPGWTSCGNEVLKLQQVSLFEEQGKLEMTADRKD